MIVMCTFAVVASIDSKAKPCNQYVEQVSKQTRLWKLKTTFPTLPLMPSNIKRMIQFDKEPAWLETSHAFLRRTFVQSSSDSVCAVVLDYNEDEKNNSKRAYESTIIETEDCKNTSQYTPDVVKSLLRSMQEVKYGNCRRSRKSFRDIFEAVVEHAKSEGVEKIAVGLGAQVWAS